MKKIKLITVLLTSFLLVSCSNTSPDPQTASPAPELGTALDLAVKKELLDISLQTDINQEITLNNFKDKTIVITPIFTSCDDICPLAAANFKAAQEAIEKAKVNEKIALLLISIDPKRDTPERLNEYRKKLKLNDSIYLLTGSEANLNTFWDGFGLAREITEITEESEHSHNDSKDWYTGEEITYEIVHSDGLFFISPDQKLKFLRLGLPDVSTIQVGQETKDFLNDEVVANLAKAVPGGWQAQDVVRILSWMLNTAIYI